MLQALLKQVAKNLFASVYGHIHVCVCVCVYLKGSDLSSEEPCKRKREKKDNEPLKLECERLKNEKQKLIEDLQQLTDQKLLHMSKLKQQYEEEEEMMLMDKTRFDNEVYATGLLVAMAVNYYMD